MLHPVTAVRSTVANASRTFVTLTACAAAFASLAWLGPGCGKESPARALHFNSIVVDTHNDVVQRILAGEDLSTLTTFGHSDLERFRDGGLDVELFSIWVPPERTSRSYYEQANEQIDSILSLAARNPDRMVMASTVADIEKGVAAGKFVGMLGVEGGHHIEDDTMKLRALYDRGVRYMTLTWNNSTSWATSASDETRDTLTREKGLTDLGRSIVSQMNAMGMLVDISHVGEETFRDALETTTKPVIASHSSVWKISPHRRNLKDWQLDAIRKNGGVVFINFAPWFIDSTFDAKETAMRKANASRIDSLTAALNEDEFIEDLKVARMLWPEYDRIRPTISQVLDHFDYVARRIGVDHVGIGSDFDGISVAPKGLDDVTKFPDLTAGLLARGFTGEDVAKILGGNFLRVLREAERR
jgi:membrane dipeptidase